VENGRGDRIEVEDLAEDGGVVHDPVPELGHAVDGHEEVENAEVDEDDLADLGDVEGLLCGRGLGAREARPRPGSASDHGGRKGGSNGDSW
jgi:hypothetical protein